MIIPFCKDCEREGKSQPRIYDQGGISTCMFVDSYWENGIYHSHDPNKHTARFSCNNGHSWVDWYYARCPAGDYPVKEKNAS